MPSSAPDLPGGSNILREANSLGVRVTSSNTFLNFDEKDENKSPVLELVPFYSGKRRFTTNAVMSGKLLEQFVSKEEGSSLTLDEVDESTICELPVGCELGYTRQETVPVYQSLAENTTVMIRNVPNRFSQDELILFFKKSGFAFNFFYCPIDFRNKCNIGYFFINLTTSDEACAFVDRFHGYQLPAYRSTKVCVASWARIQGYSQNVEHYINSPIIHMGRQFRPRVFDLYGEEMLLPGQLPTPSVNQITGNTRKLFVGGLAPATTPESIKEHLSQFGEIEDVSIILDSVSKSSRGFAFVTFVDPDSVEQCALDRESHFIDGRSVGIRPYMQTR